MDPFTLALVGGALLLLFKAKPAATTSSPPQQQQSQQSPTTTQENKSPPTIPTTELAVGALIASSVGAVGQYYADNFTGGWGGSKGLASKVATPVGVGVGGGLFGVLGGTTGALAVTGGALLPAAALIVVPAIVLTVIILAYVQIAETRIKQEKFVQYYDRVYKLIHEKKFQEAWNAAVEAYEQHQLSGLGFTLSWPEAIPAQVEFYSDASRTSVVKVDVASTMKAAYAHSQSKGDEIAFAINSAIPWMVTIQRSGTDTKVIPNGAVRRAYSPYAAAERAAIKAEMAMLNPTTYEATKKELAKVRGESKVDPHGTKNKDTTGNRTGKGGY